MRNDKTVEGFRIFSFILFAEIIPPKHRGKILVVTQVRIFVLGEFFYQVLGDKTLVF